MSTAPAMITGLPASTIWLLYDIQVTPSNNIIILPALLYAEMAENNCAARREFARLYHARVGLRPLYVQDLNPLRVLLGPLDYFVTQTVIRRPGQLPLYIYPNQTHVSGVQRLASIQNAMVANAHALNAGGVNAGGANAGAFNAGAVNGVAVTAVGVNGVGVNGVAAPAVALVNQNNAKIPRPPNAFICYRKDYHDAVKAEYPGIHNNEISKIIGTMWQGESAEVRGKYVEMAEDLKREHSRLHPGYKYQPRKAAEKKRRMTKKKAAALAAAEIDRAGDAACSDPLINEIARGRNGIYNPMSVSVNGGPRAWLHPSAASGAEPEFSREFHNGFKANAPQNEAFNAFAFNPAAAGHQRVPTPEDAADEWVDPAGTQM